MESRPVLFIFIGDNDYAINEAVGELRAKVGPPDLLEANSHLLEASRTTLAELRATCEAAPFLAESRLVVVRGLLSLFEPRQRQAQQREGPSERVTKEWSGLEQLADTLPSTTLLVMVDGRIGSGNSLLKRLRPKATVRNFPLLRDTDLARWIRKRVAGLDARIAPGAISLLVQWVGKEQWILTTELDKLSVYASGETITEGHVRALVPQVQEASIFAAVDALVEGRLAAGVRLMRRLRADGAGFSYINAMLARQLRMVVLAKEMLEEGSRPEEAGKRLGIDRDFVLRRVVQQAWRSSWPRLKSLYRGLLDADLAVKRGELDEDLALELLLTRFSQPQAAGRFQS